MTTERFDEPWYLGEAVGTVVLLERDGKATLTHTIRYDPRAIRDMVLKTPDGTRRECKLRRARRGPGVLARIA